MRKKRDPIKVDEIQTSYFKTERQYGFGTSTSILLRLQASDGSIGIGEIPDVEDANNVPSKNALENKIADFLISQNPLEINRMANIMGDQIDFGPFNPRQSFQRIALKGIETALYDLVGDRYNIPVYQLLGGFVKPVPVTWVVYTRAVPNEIEGLEKEIQNKVDEGFTSFKLKVGGLDVEDDYERIQTVRNIAGEDATILLDAQAEYTTQEAISSIRKFEPLGIDGIETPVSHPDPDIDAPMHYNDLPVRIEDLIEVRDAVDTPIMEHVPDSDFGLQLAMKDAVDVFTVSVSKGGINFAKQLLEIADAANIDARLGTTVELGVGAAAAVALGSSSTTVTYPCDINGPALYRKSPLKSPLEYKNGTFTPRDSPGFGFELQKGLF